MSEKGTSYASKHEVDDFESITEKLAQDLRKSIRLLENFPLLSDPWFEMTETFGRIATISEMEANLPGDKRDGTLWETDEQALRFIMEDGKLNLCLRLLIEFKSEQIKTRKSGKGPMLDFTTECDKFEKGLGVVFKNAWQHVEVLQTSDLPALVNHIADVLDAALEEPQIIEDLTKKGDLHTRQEVLVFYYLHDICKHSEDIREERVMPIMRERGMFMLAVRAMCLFAGTLHQMHKLKAAEALSALIETEDFQTYKDQHFNADGFDVQTLVELKDIVLSDVTKEYSLRRLIRPLIDCIDKAKRLSRK